MCRDSAPLTSLSVVAILLTGLAGSTAMAGTAAAGDFNGDGFIDLAMGIPQEDVNGILDAGAVAVIYGSATGLNAATPVDDQFWHRDKTGIEGDLGASFTYGTSLAAGDFNGDTFCDLAIGVPGDSLPGGLGNAVGAVNVMHGSSTGLKAANDQLIHQDSPDVEGMRTAADVFGTALAAGNFNGDGFDDLAIGAPFDSDGGLLGGAVNVIYGTAAGLDPAGAVADQIFHQNSLNVDDSCELADAFGTALAVGDFNNDGRDDLTIGVAHEAVVAVEGAGAVHMLLGSAAGLTATGSKLFAQGSTIGVAGVLGAAETNDAFGTALASGDFDNDGFFDLAVGIPAQAVGGSGNAGAIQLFYGAVGGLNADRDKVFHQDTAGIAEQADPLDPGGDTKDGEGFGLALAAGLFNADAVWDLTIGAPNEDLVTSEEGVVHLLFGVQGDGIKASGSKLFKQGTNGLLDAPETGDHFGFALAAGDFNNDGRDDLAIGAPGEVVGAALNTGSVHVLKNGGTTGNKIWHQNKTSIKDSCETGDSFGAGLAP